MARKPLPRHGLSEAIEMDNGETLHGYYRGTRVVNTNHGDQTIHEFEAIDGIAGFGPGKLVGIWGSLVLDDLMESATMHAESWITFQGVKGRTKVYTMDQDPEKITERKPAGPDAKLPEDIPF